MTHAPRPNDAWLLGTATSIKMLIHVISFSLGSLLQRVRHHHPLPRVSIAVAHGSLHSTKYAKSKTASFHILTIFQSLSYMSIVTCTLEMYSGSTGRGSGSATNHPAIEQKHYLACILSTWTMIGEVSFLLLLVAPPRLHWLAPISI